MAAIHTMSTPRSVTQPGLGLPKSLGHLSQQQQRQQRSADRGSPDDDGLQASKIRKTPRRRLKYRIDREDLLRYPEEVLKQYFVDSGIEAEANSEAIMNEIWQQWRQPGREQQRLPEFICDLGAGKMKEFKDMLDDSRLSANGQRYLRDERERRMNRLQKQNSRKRKGGSCSRNSGDETDSRSASRAGSASMRRNVRVFPSHTPHQAPFHLHLSSLALARQQQRQQLQSADFESSSPVSVRASFGGNSNGVAHGATASENTPLGALSADSCHYGAIPVQPNFDDPELLLSGNSVEHGARGATGKAAKPRAPQPPLMPTSANATSRHTGHFAMPSTRPSPTESSAPTGKSSMPTAMSAPADGLDGVPADMQFVATLNGRPVMVPRNLNIDPAVIQRLISEAQSQGQHQNMHPPSPPAAHQRQPSPPSEPTVVQVHPAPITATDRSRGHQMLLQQMPNLLSRVHTDSQTGNSNTEHGGSSLLERELASATQPDGTGSNDPQLQQIRNYYALQLDALRAAGMAVPASAGQAALDIITSMAEQARQNLRPHDHVEASEQFAEPRPRHTKHRSRHPKAQEDSKAAAHASATGLDALASTGGLPPPPKRAFGESVTGPSPLRPPDIPQQLVECLQDVWASLSARGPPSHGGMPPVSESAVANQSAASRAATGQSDATDADPEAPSTPTKQQPNVLVATPLQKEFASAYPLLDIVLSPMMPRARHAGSTGQTPMESPSAALLHSGLFTSLPTPFGLLTSPMLGQNSNSDMFGTGQDQDARSARMNLDFRDIQQMADLFQSPTARFAATDVMKGAASNDGPRGSKAGAASGNTNDETDATASLQPFPGMYPVSPAMHGHDGSILVAPSPLPNLYTNSPLPFLMSPLGSSMPQSALNLFNAMFSPRMGGSMDPFTSRTEAGESEEGKPGGAEARAEDRAAGESNGSRAEAEAEPMVVESRPALSAASGTAAPKSSSRLRQHARSVGQGSALLEEDQSGMPAEKRAKQQPEAGSRLTNRRFSSGMPVSPKSPNVVTSRLFARRSSRDWNVMDAAKPRRRTSINLNQRITEAMDSGASAGGEANEHGSRGESPDVEMPSASSARGDAALPEHADEETIIAVHAATKPESDPSVRSGAAGTSTVVGKSSAGQEASAPVTVASPVQPSVSALKFERPPHTSPAVASSPERAIPV
ncbi:uncharacterized protein MONBRDRAFT_28622 [Monosiga brevicollis MX1]|uniref:Uncharacterized protein n=1 Tax=Monosiga brevicollis TaxID=81824 RepID=A9V8Q0_MONBE|nr:uncharacterized protein MONBRDRAFT_28622 [Monosiga brevicollis MX1]EDQ86124.1 predicted protein [Monosiga brevicollis MX1]|eukprot:XP_001749049.1 hypothetical protein [Monosiga brevicollis MX1]